MLKSLNLKDLNGNEIHEGDTLIINDSEWYKIGLSESFVKHFGIDEVRAYVIPTGNSLNVKIKYSAWQNNTPIITNAEAKSFLFETKVKGKENEKELTDVLNEEFEGMVDSEMYGHTVDCQDGMDLAHGFEHLDKTIISSLDGERISWLPDEIATISMAGLEMNVTDSVLIELSDKALQFVLERHALMDTIAEQVPLKGEFKHLKLTFKRKECITLDHNFMPCNSKGEACVYKHTTNQEAMNKLLDDNFEKVKTEIDQIKSSDLSPEEQSIEREKVLERSREFNHNVIYHDDALNEVLMDSIFIALFNVESILEYLESLDCKFSIIQNDEKINGQIKNNEKTINHTTTDLNG